MMTLDLSEMDVNTNIESELILYSLVIVCNHCSGAQQSDDPTTLENQVKVIRKKVSYTCRYNMQLNFYVFRLLRKRRGCIDSHDKIIPVNELIIPNHTTHWP